MQVNFYQEMTRGEGYYRVWKEVECFEEEFIRQHRDDFFTIEEDKQEEWINETIQEYLDEWVSSYYYLSYREKMAIISNYGLCEALALANDMGTSIHDAICPEDTLIYAIIKEEFRISADDFKKEIEENDESE
jgi:hypothetical protein